MDNNPLPKAPGKSFADMYELTFLGNRFKDDFSDRLLLAIFWEETCFNNIHQSGKGTAVGFGQVEPSEFWKLKPYGLGLPPTRKIVTRTMVSGKEETTTKTVAGSIPTEAQSVQMTACILHALRQHFKSQKACLEAYAGLEYAKQQEAAKKEIKPSSAERSKIIENWKLCEEALMNIKPFQTYGPSEQEVILKALNTAKPFTAVREEFRKVLFPAKPAI